MSEHPSAEISQADLPRLRAIPGGRDGRSRRSERQSAPDLVPSAPRELRPVLPGDRQPPVAREPRPLTPGDRQPPASRGRRPQLVREPLWREALGQRLRELRQEQRETLVETAGRAGVSPQYLSEVERGRKEPSSEMIAAMAGALGTSLGGLIQQVADDLVRHRPAGFTRAVAPQASNPYPGLLLAA
ncbi:helix-turn-helix domain-containing protein [Nocardia uniformis]|uniref:helix-turn-helix domain-containing protein n=1 Tax=Nocardia uniformis TaxID=53432 RepID=UPI000A0155EA